MGAVTFRYYFVFTIPTSPAMTPVSPHDHGHICWSHLLVTVIAGFFCKTRGGPPEAGGETFGLQLCAGWTGGGTWDFAARVGTLISTCPKTLNIDLKSAENTEL